MNTSASAQSRDIVYCHECENEWYRDEHGLMPCPECGGEFTEVIEENHDPREQDDSYEDSSAPLNHHGYYAPDPEEEDVDHFQQRDTHGAQAHQRDGSQPQTGPSLVNTLGSMFQSIFNGAAPPQMSPDSPQHQFPQQHPFPQQFQQQNRPGNGTTFIRHDGPNISIVYSTTRNTHGPQPQMQHDEMAQLMMQMISNIGVVPRGQTHLHQPGAFGHPVFPGAFGGEPPSVESPLQDIFRLVGGVQRGVFGDAVFSQEAFDRIITQTMEAHQSGNAPGPAPEAAIAALPTKPIGPADLDDRGKADCSICMDEVALGTRVTVLPCTHWFHYDCIKAWLGEHDTCPHCRKGIVAKDGDAASASASSGPPRVPGEFPGSSSTGSSGDARRGASPESPGRASRQGSTLFSRMRETFGGENGGGGGGWASGNSGGNAGRNDSPD